MPRPLDEPIPSNESMFYGIKAEWYSDGDRLTEEAIRLPCISCDRERYLAVAGDPTPVLSRSPGLTGIAVTTPGELPKPDATPASPVVYGFRAADDPLDENAAHSEIRLDVVEPRREYDADWKPSSALAKKVLKGRLAERFRVLLRPAGRSRSG